MTVSLADVLGAGLIVAALVTGHWLLALYGAAFIVISQGHRWAASKLNNK